MTEKVYSIYIVETLVRNCEVILNMQAERITNPEPEYKVFMCTIVPKLSKLSLDDEINVENNAMKDSIGNIIVEFS